MLIEVRRVDEAETLLRQALDIHLTKRGKRSPVVGRTRGSLARLLEASGRSEEAAEVSEKAKFDVFISYGSRDSDVVQDLAEKLTERGLSVWFDQWQLRPGDSIRRALTEAISSAASFVFCIGQAGPGGGMQDELSKSLARREQKNQLIIPLILPDGDPDQIPLHLREYQFLDTGYPLDASTHNKCVHHRPSADSGPQHIVITCVTWIARFLIYVASYR